MSGCSGPLPLADVVSMWDRLEVLLLIIVANGAPILLDRALGHRFNRPLDGGVRLSDGRRLLGASATIRGVAAAVLFTAAAAYLIGHGARMGVLIGLWSMLGDALSSFVKRRVGLAPGDKATGLDQLPESLAPLLVVAGHYGFGWLDIALIALAFTLFDIAISRLLFRLRIRRRPH